MASKFTYPGLKGILVGLGVLIISVTATGVRSDETEKSLPVALATFKENKPSTISINIKGQEPLGETTPRITPILITPEEPVAKVALLVNPNPQNSIEYSLQSDNNEPEYNELKYSEQPNAPQQILYPPTTIAMASRIVDQQAVVSNTVNQQISPAPLPQKKKEITGQSNQNQSSPVQELSRISNQQLFAGTMDQSTVSESLTQRLPKPLTQLMEMVGPNVQNENVGQTNQPSMSPNQELPQISNQQMFAGIANQSMVSESLTQRLPRPLSQLMEMVGPNVQNENVGQTNQPSISSNQKLPQISNQPLIAGTATQKIVDVPQQIIIANPPIHLVAVSDAEKNRNVGQPGQPQAPPVEGLGQMPNPPSLDATLSQAQQPTPSPSSNQSNQTLGEAPRDNSLQFLRTETVLLKPCEWQVDIGLSYLYDHSDFTDVIPPSTLIEARIRRRLLTMPVEVRYGLFDRVQLFANLPFGWANTEISELGEADFLNNGGIGDLNAGASVHLIKSNGYSCSPDVVATFGVTAPTGKGDTILGIFESAETTLGQGFWAGQWL
ncbi:MAG TPA: hypothetical protein VIH42_09065, partial [Thermoguttaceae bacterium]